MASHPVPRLTKIDDFGAALYGGFSVGGVSVGLAGQRSADVALVPSLQPFRIDTSASDIQVRVEWVAESIRALFPRCLNPVRFGARMKAKIAFNSTSAFPFLERCLTRG